MTYSVYRGVVTNGEGTTPIVSGITSVTGVTFTNTSLTNGTLYDYKVSAVGTNGIEGAASSVVSAIPTELIKPVFGSASVPADGLSVLIALIEADSPPILGSSSFSLSVTLCRSARRA